ncbi:MAG: hypothetical protein R3F61_25765 [Myxococcota bacterium]
MSDLDALLARSRDPGAFVERRQFTLSRDKALEKMRQFTLRHPGQYALEIVQAAVMLDARWMFADVTQDEATLGWIGGRPISTTELDGLFDYLFASESVKETRPLRQIAIAVNVLLQRKPEILRIESGDSERAARLDLNPDGTGTIGIPEYSPMGTYVYVRFRSQGWLPRFRSRRVPPAAELIETECMYSPTSIFLNGDGPFGWDPHTRLRGMAPVQRCFWGDGRDGWIGVDSQDPRPLVTLVVGGVRISRREIPELGPGVSGVIRDDSLVKTADMSDIVDDASWRRLLHYLQPIARQLHHASYVLPELPPLIEERAEADDTPQLFEPPPLDEGVRMLGRDELVEVASLARLDPADRVYWIAPEHLDALRDALDPLRFPERVLVITPDQALSLGAELPALGLHRVLPDDAAFVVEQRAKSVRTSHYLVNLPDSTVRIQLHLDGRLPGWREPRRDGPVETTVPLLVASRGHAVGIYALPVSAPGVSLVVEVDAWEPEDRWKHVAMAAGAARKHLWRLVPDDPQRVQRAHSELCRALLVDTIEMLPDPGGPPVLRFPSNWPAEARHVLDTPLVRSGLTARAFVDAVGTHQVLEVADLGEVNALAPLAERFGVGHLTCPELSRLWLAELRWDGARWRPADTADPGAEALALVRLGSSFAPAPPEGWSTAASPHPVLLAAQRTASMEVPWNAGWAGLAALLASEHDPSLTPWSGSSVHRADLVRLAVLALHPHVPAGPLMASSRHEVSLAQVLDGVVRVAFRGGPEVMESETVLVTADEAAVLTSLGARLRWRFDDAPSVWTQVPVEGDDWIARVEVAGDTGRGWLGLRHPYDPTGSVFLRRGWRTHVASELDRHIRCHGFVHTRGEGAQEGLSELQDSALELLERLLVVLSGDLPAERRVTAERYAADFAWMALHPANPIPQALADRLADAVTVPMPDGEKWGSMRLWLLSRATVRPTFPFAVHGFMGDAVAIDAHSVGEEPEDTTEGPSVETILHHAVQRMVVGIEVEIHAIASSHRIEAWGGGRLRIALGMRDVLVAAALAGDRRALARVVLRIARAVHGSEARLGVVRDYADMQRQALAALDAFGPR